MDAHEDRYDEDHERCRAESRGEETRPLAGKAQGAEHERHRERDRQQPPRHCAAQRFARDRPSQARVRGRARSAPPPSAMNASPVLIEVGV
jgi:hypothetical protein